MLTVTDAAREHLADMLDQASAPDTHAVRVVASEQGVALQVDEPTEQDEAHAHNGKTVLILDSNVQQMLDGRTLDVNQTEQGAMLSLS